MPHVPQCPQASQVEGYINNAYIKDALMDLTQLMMTQVHFPTNHLVAQANQGGGPQPNVSTPTSRILDFMRMKPSNFHGPKVDDDPQSFLDEVFKVVDVMSVNLREKT